MWILLGSSGLVPGCGDGPDADADASDCLRSLTVLEGDDPLAYSVAWSPVSEHALGGTEHELRLMAIEDDGGQLRVADRHVGSGTVMSIAWTRDGTQALTAGGDGQLHLFDVDLEAETLELRSSLLMDAQGLFSVALSPDERHALACGADGFLSLLEVDLPGAELSVVDRFPAHRRCVVARFSPTGSHAVSLGPEQSTLVYRVDAEVGNLEALAVVRSGEEPGAVAFGEDERELLLGTFGASRRLSYSSFDPASGTLREHQAFDDFDSGLKVIEPDHRAQRFIIAAHDGAPRLYERNDDGPALVWVDSLGADGSGTHAVAWSSDDRRMIRAASQRDRFEILGVERCAPSR